MLLSAHGFTVRRFSSSRLRFGGFVDFDIAHARQAFGIITPQKFNQTFAHFAAEIERLARIGATDQSAYFYCALLGVGDLQSAYSSVVLLLVFEQPFRFIAFF